MPWTKREQILEQNQNTPRHRAPPLFGRGESRVYV